MTIKSFEHQYKGFGTHPSKCIVEIRDGETESYITFIDAGQGTSVTNASEQLANEVRDMAANAKIRFFERYVRNEAERKAGVKHTYDEVTYTEKNGAFHSPKWKHLGETAYNKIVNNNL